MSATAARTILTVVAVITGFPLFALLGFLFSFVLIGGGLLQAMNGAPFKGIISSLIFTCAFYGIFTLSNLVIHFWRTPFQNPTGKSALKYGAGLILGWLALLALILGVIEKSAEVIIGSLTLLPVAFVISFFWILNKVLRNAQT